MKYAVVKTGGKQYKVTEGATLEVERLITAPASDFICEEVLLYVADDGTVKIGNPVVAGVKVRATVLAQTKGDKIRVAKFKAKVRHRRLHGHRQSLSMIKIEEISDFASVEQSLDKKTALIDSEKEKTATKAKKA